MHVIRDCWRAKEVWKSLVPSSVAAEFFSLELKDWALWLLRMGMEGIRLTWWSERMALIYMFDAVAMEECRGLQG